MRAIAKFIHTQQQRVGAPRAWVVQKGLTTKIHLAVDAPGMPLRVLITEGTHADCKQATEHIEGMRAEHLIADKGYDSQAHIIEQACSQGMQTHIPSRKNQKGPAFMTTDTCTPNAIWLRTPSCISSSGAELRRDTLRICPPS